MGITPKAGTSTWGRDKSYSKDTPMGMGPGWEHPQSKDPSLGWRIRGDKSHSSPTPISW